MILDIKKDGNEILSSAANQVPHGVDMSLLIENMFETMHSAKGIGLAANQVGVLERIIVIGTPGLRQAIINPVITDRKLGMSRSEEGCLSFPGIKRVKKRSKMIVVEGFDENWNSIKLKLRGLASMCVQHEIDHLNGITIK